MPTLPRYFVEKSLRKVQSRLGESQQRQIDVLLSMLNDEGLVNITKLREALFPQAAPKSANTMLNRFFDGIDEAAAKQHMVFSVKTTADKKAGDKRVAWFEGIAESPVHPHTSDLNGVPVERRIDDYRGQVLGKPVLLVTFNEHETRALLAGFDDAPAPDFDGPHAYTQLGVHGGQEVIHVLSKQGRKDAQATVSAAIARHQPSAIIAVGIACGANKGKQAIGDVLVSEYLCDYESARLNADGSVIQRGARPPASPLLLGRVRVLDQRRGDETGWPTVHIGALLCGDKLIDDPAVLTRLKACEPEAIGIEMEAAGIEKAASAARVDWIVIKGISDWGDGRKNTKSKELDQRRAADNAVRVVKALLETGNLDPAPTERGQQTHAKSDARPVGKRDASCRSPTAMLMGLKDLCDVPGAHIDGEAKGAPARLDGKKNESDKPARQNAAEADAGTPVMPYLLDWIADPASPPLFALLGEYGMGKTITCQLLAKQLDTQRQRDPTCPIPLYFDLRHVTRLNERVPTLDQVLDECMKRGWLDDGNSEAYTLENVHRWIAQGAVAIFDGLDEELVKLSAADGLVFTNNLLKLLADAAARAKAERRPLQIKMLVSCRTQYFPTLKAQNSHFTQTERGEFGADHYRAMLLLPWGEGQVSTYLAKALPEMDTGRLLEMVRSVHNLEELTQRPYTLKLVAEFIPDIEHERAAGRTVYGVTLYRKMAEKWLARDSGKHHIGPEHKLRLAAHLAAHLWQSGRNALPVGELNCWFHAWLDSEADLQRRYARLDPEQLEEDLRTATFLARQDDGEKSAFRFAHTSLQEFFLATYLLAAVRENRPRRWAMHTPSRETLDFLGQLLGEAAEPELLQTLQAWRKIYAARTSELLLAYALRAYQRGWPVPILHGIDLRGAALRGVQIAGKPGRTLALGPARFDGADLREATLAHLALDGAHFDGAQMARANILHCTARSASFDGSELTATIFRKCDLWGTQWREACGYRPQWLCCEPCVADWPDGPARQTGITKLLQAPALPAADICDARLAWLSCSPGYVVAWAPKSDIEGRHWLAGGGIDGALQLWDSVSGEIGLTLHCEQGWIWACAWAPVADAGGRSWLASAGDDGTLRLWDSASGEAGPVLCGHEREVLACAWAPLADAGGRLWLASTGNDGTVRLWDSASGEAGPVLRGHEEGVAACAWAPVADAGGRLLLASAGNDGTVRLWNGASGEARLVLRGHEGMVTACAWAPAADASGRLWLASGGHDGTVRLWDGASGEAGPVLLAHEGGVNACAWAPSVDADGRLWLASTGEDGTVRLWDGASGEAGLVLPGHKEGGSACAWAPSADASGRLWLASADYDATVRLWDSASGEIGPMLQGHEEWMATCAWAPIVDAGGQLWLASAGHGGRVRLWNGVSGKAGPVLRGHEGGVAACSWAPSVDAEGRFWLAGAANDGTVRLWDIVSGEVGPILRGHEGRVDACAWAPSADAGGRLWLASAGHDGTVRLWDGASGEAGPVLRGHEGRVVACAWAPTADAGGRLWLASASDDGTVRLWDCASGEAGPVLRGHEWGVTACAWAPSADSGGRLWLASAGYDGAVRLWDGASGEAGPVLLGHDRGVAACAWAPSADAEGRLWLASACHDGTVRLWDGVSGEAGPVLRGHEGGVTACAWAPSDKKRGHWLASVNNDTLRLWDVELGECVRSIALCRGGPDREAGHAVWDPRNNQVLEVAGDAWRYLAWLRPLSGAFAERLPLDTFGPVPLKGVQ